MKTVIVALLSGFVVMMTVGCGNTNENLVPENQGSVLTIPLMARIQVTNGNHFWTGGDEIDLQIEVVGTPNEPLSIVCVWPDGEQNDEVRILDRTGRYSTTLKYGTPDWGCVDFWSYGVECTMTSTQEEVGVFSKFFLSSGDLSGCFNDNDGKGGGKG